MLQQLHISHVRNIQSASLTLHPRCNLIVGANGSGKTSLLEAIFLLLRGRSFRSPLAARVIHYEADLLTVFGQVHQAETLLPVGIEKTKQGATRVRIAHETAASALPLLHILPVQLLGADSQALLHAGPKKRRAFLDWGVFHVEHAFLKHWGALRRALQQRNAALRQAKQTGVTNTSLIRLWDPVICSASEALHQLRDHYLEALQPLLISMLEKFLPNHEVDIQYKPGWNLTDGLEAVLAHSLARDIQLGYTQYGAQRADLSLMHGKYAVQDVLSQGQQKLLVYAMKLAQGQLLQQQSKRRCLFLLDDLAAELDANKRLIVLQTLQALDAQVCITALDENEMPAVLSELYQDYTLFHVEQGAVVVGASKQIN